MAVTSALLRRARWGEGSQVSIALADVALACVGNMGWLAEADLTGEARPRHGNHMFGSFGVDFETRDRRRVMVVALTEGQRRALVQVTETTEIFAALGTLLEANLEQESHRYRLRESIAAVLRPWFAQRSFDEIAALLDAAKALEPLPRHGRGGGPCNHLIRRNGDDLDALASDRCFRLLAVGLGGSAVRSSSRTPSRRRH